MAIAPSADTASASAPGSRPAANPVPQPRPQPRVAARPTQPTPPAGNAPLSLAPDSGAAPPPAANTAPPPRAAAPPRPAPVVASAGGGFVVQVSSRRSEADAEAAYRNLQGKYTSVLNGQPHAVKRADLGAKGVFYRAVVGPYGTRDQAIQLCSSLKAAGGDCVVVAN
jgi:cell division septation protein DedD